MLKPIFALLGTALGVFGVVTWLKHRREVAATSVVEPEAKAA